MAGDESRHCTLLQGPLSGELSQKQQKTNKQVTIVFPLINAGKVLNNPKEGVLIDGRFST